MNLCESGGILALLALAQTVVLLTGNFDLSIEKNMIFTAIIGAYFVSSGPMALGTELNIPTTVLIMIVVGGVVGSINGFLIGYLKTNAFMTTLSMLIVLSGLNRFIVPREYGLRIFPFPSSFNFFGRGYIGPIPMPIIAVIFLYALIGFILKKTPFGRSLYAVGGNANAAAVSGVNVRRIVFLSYVISGMISGLTGWMIAGRFGVANPVMSTNQVLYAIAIPVLGGVSLSGGVGTVTGVFGGALLILSAFNIMNLSGVGPYFFSLGGALIIFFSVFFNTLRNKISI